MAEIAASTLDAYLGKSIGQICGNRYTTPHESHCAHFVCHALEIKIGTLCGDMQWKTRHTAATLRVNELYNGLANRGPWDQRPSKSKTQIVFVIRKAYMTHNIMQLVDQKHVGIYLNGAVYNYSNSHHRVVKDESDQAFYKKFDELYAGDDIALYYGARRSFWS
jgi:hypothetical protein